MTRHKYQIISFLNGQYRKISQNINSFFKKNPLYLNVEDFKEYNRLHKIVNDKIYYFLRTRFGQDLSKDDFPNLNWDNIENPLTIRELIQSLKKTNEKILSSYYPEMQFKESIFLSDPKVDDYRTSFQNIRKQLSKLEKAIKEITLPDEMDIKKPLSLID